MGMRLGLSLCPGVVDMGRGMREARFLLPGVAILFEVGVRSDGGVPSGNIKEGDPDAELPLPHRTLNATLLRGVVSLKLLRTADFRMLLVGSTFVTGEEGADE